MIFRPATKNDLDAVMSVIEDGRASLAACGLDQWQGADPSRAGIARDIERGFTRVAVDERNGDIVGTLSFMDAGDADYDNVLEGAWLTDLPNVVADGKASYVALHRLAVAAGATRQGVATFMIGRAVDLARKRSLVSVRADTHEGNIPMQRTFEKCGMTRCCKAELLSIADGTKLRVGYELVL